MKTNVNQPAFDVPMRFPGVESEFGVLLVRFFFLLLLLVCWTAQNGPPSSHCLAPPYKTNRDTHECKQSDSQFFIAPNGRALSATLARQRLCSAISYSKENITIIHNIIQHRIHWDCMGGDTRECELDVLVSHDMKISNKSQNLATTTEKLRGTREKEI